MQLQTHNAWLAKVAPILSGKEVGVQGMGNGVVHHLEGLALCIDTRALKPRLAYLFFIPFSPVPGFSDNHRM